jgi:hypothetical protein
LGAKGRRFRAAENRAKPPESDQLLLPALVTTIRVAVHFLMAVYNDTSPTYAVVASVATKRPDRRCPRERQQQRYPDQMAQNTCVPTHTHVTLRQYDLPQRTQHIGGRLGNGSFGTVVEAYNDTTGERVAVKQMPLAAEDPRKQEQIKVRRTCRKGSPTA